MGFVEIEPDGEHLIIALHEEDDVDEVFVFLSVDAVGKMGFLLGADARPFVGGSLAIASQMRVAAEARAHKIGTTARLVRFVRGREITTH